MAKKSQFAFILNQLTSSVRNSFLLYYSEEEYNRLKIEEEKLLNELEKVEKEHEETMKTQQSKSEFRFHGINYMFYLRVISYVHVCIQFGIKHF